MTDYRDIIIRPIITEKSMKLMNDNNKYTFQVAKTANKVEIAKAVEDLFKVDVTSVNTINTKSKPKRVGRYEGKTQSIKKAIVTVKAGQTIDLFGEEE
jgi:large subunit ribosomal protein L23